MIVRIRALPSGTVGKAMPVPSTPSLNSSRENSIVSRPSPMMMGVIGVSLAGVVWPPMLKPSSPSSFFQKRVFSQSISIHCGSLSSTSKAAIQVAATEGGCEVENRIGRPMIKKIDQIASAAHISPEGADRLRQSTNLDVDTPVHPEVIDRATPVAAEYAGSVRVIHHHDRATFFGRLAQAGKRADVAIHREHAVGDQQLFPRLILHGGELLLSVGNVLMPEDENLRP